MHMQFSEDSHESYFFSQPHQPFFILAFVNAIITMIVFLLSYKDLINLSINPISYHTYGLIFLMFTPAFLAFLFTTYPKFNATDGVDKDDYIHIFSVYYLGATIFLLGSIASPVMSGLAMLILFYGHIKGVLILKNIYHNRSHSDSQDTYWMLIAMIFGVVSHAIFILSEFFYSPALGLSTEIAIYLYLFLLTFTVAQRMIPFFSHSVTDKNRSLLKNIFLLLVAHIILEGIETNSSFFIDILLSIILFREIRRWKLPFPNPNPLVWILHLSMLWVPVAFLLGGITNFITGMGGPTFFALDTHLIMVGFIFTILIGFGTRVTIGHSGNSMNADKWITFLFYWTQVVVVTRVILSFASAYNINFNLFFDLSVYVWITMFTLWGLRFFNMLIVGKQD